MACSCGLRRGALIVCCQGAVQPKVPGFHWRARPLRPLHEGDACSCTTCRYCTRHPPPTAAAHSVTSVSFSRHEDQPGVSHGHEHSLASGATSSSLLNSSFRACGAVLLKSTAAAAAPGITVAVVAPAPAASAAAAAAAAAAASSPGDSRLGAVPSMFASDAADAGLVCMARGIAAGAHASAAPMPAPRSGSVAGMLMVRAPSSAEASLLSATSVATISDAKAVTTSVLGSDASASAISQSAAAAQPHGRNSRTVSALLPAAASMTFTPLSAGNVVGTLSDWSEAGAVISLVPEPGCGLAGLATSTGLRRAPPCLGVPPSEPVSRSDRVPPPGLPCCAAAVAALPLPLLLLLRP